MRRYGRHEDLRLDRRGRVRAAVDAKDFDPKESVRYETNCGLGAANPSAIYIRPFCIDGAIFRGDEAASDAKCRFAKRSRPSPLPMI